MASRNGAWQALGSLIARAAARLGADARTGRARIVGGCRALFRTMRSGRRRLRQLRTQIREQVRDGQRNSQLVWQDALREDRRARRRSLTLLLKLLNPQQRREFRESRHFVVTGGSTGDRYRIRVERIANIDVLQEDGSVKWRLCVIPTGGVPIYDVMAAQLLHLQDPVSEQRLLKQANVFPVERVTAFSRSVWIS